MADCFLIFPSPSCPSIPLAIEDPYAVAFYPGVAKRCLHKVFLVDSKQEQESHELSLSFVPFEKQGPSLRQKPGHSSTFNMAPLSHASGKTLTLWLCPVDGKYQQGRNPRRRETVHRVKNTGCRDREDGLGFPPTPDKLLQLSYPFSGHED